MSIDTAPCVADLTEVLAADLDAQGRLTLTRPGRARETEAARALVLVRNDGAPRASVTLERAVLEDPARLQAAVSAVLADAAEEALADLTLRKSLPPDDAPFSSLVTVCIPTAGRPEQLARALRSLVVQTYTEFELLVVDNTPQLPGTRDVVEGLGDPRVRWLPEPAPGSSVARNAAVGVARGELIVFTDDDVVADPCWLAEMVGAFGSDPRITCVTGLVMPYELDTPAQRHFEQYGGFGKGFSAALHVPGRRAGDPLYPFQPGQFGSGNSMAFRTEVLAAAGGFDTRLGAGSKSRAGADIESFLQVLLRGECLRYEPRALVWHQHRRDEGALVRQVGNYGAGLSAIAAKCLTSPGSALALISRLPLALWFLLAPGSAKNAHRGADYPKNLVYTELRGILAGGWLFLLAWRADRHLPHPLPRPRPLRDALRRHLREPMFRSAYLLMLSSVLTGALGITYWGVAARAYSLADVGRGSAAVLTLVTLANIGQLNLGGALTRYLPNPSVHRGSLVATCYAAAAAAGGALALGTLTLLPVVGVTLEFLPTSASGRAGWTLAAAAWCVFTLQDYVLVGTGRAVWVPIENAAFGIAKIVLLLALAQTLPTDGILLSWLVPAALTVLVVTLLARRGLWTPRTPGQRRFPSGLGRFVAGDYLGAVIGYLPVLVVPALVVSTLGAAANASFGTALLLVATIDYGVRGYATSLTVSGAGGETPVPVLLRRMLRGGSTLVVPGTLAVVVLAPQILALFGPAYVEGGTTPLRLMALSCLPRALVALHVSACRLENEVPSIVLVQTVGAVASLGLGIVGLHLGGVDGLAGGLTLGALVGAIPAVAGLRRRWPQDGPPTVETTWVAPHLRERPHR